MQTIESIRSRTQRQAFTLIEMMIVVVVISILIGGVFKLMSTASANNKRAVTIARLERLQNALSGFYALYGTYPPVEQYGSPNPFETGRKDDFGDTLESSLDARSAAWASKCQPVAFEFPYSKNKGQNIAKAFQIQGKTVSGVYDALGGTADSTTLSSDWEKVKVKMFKFGLLSYLLPRVEVIGFPGGNEYNEKSSDDCTDIAFYQSNQWKNNNLTSKTGQIIEALNAQRQIENAACARWLPNFEGLIYGGNENLLGIKTSNGGGGLYNYRRSFITDYNGGNDEEDHCLANDKFYNGTVLRSMTIRDGWNQEFYYHSEPPYQSYRIWSAGPNENTFPPWISIDRLKTAGIDIAKVVEWTKDDIVGFDR